MLELPVRIIKGIPFQIKYLLEYWKLIIHLLFRTYRFGVNNEWWWYEDGSFGLPWYKSWHLIREYQSMRFRACACGFIPAEKAKKLFPIYWYVWKEFKTTRLLLF